ncbi:hypothetical protein QWY14_10400 [Planococcus sp. N028]|uniref:Uncharacterized protein n=1 Tax=Planococcus shixiaomingii TaxID=3058393 RepID=A0ABT8N3H5_9BACL|nr:hypothetical protein [Planococcus sp. N028]MDN7242212.1 hypothetical protein [Planococcus sp. N028]
MIYEELAENLLFIVKNKNLNSTFTWYENFGFTYRKNYTGDMARPYKGKVSQKQGYFDFVIHAGTWKNINHHSFLEEILKYSKLESCEYIWAGESPLHISENKKEKELLITLALLMFEQEVNWGNESWQRKSNFCPDYNFPFLQRPRDMLMGFISMAFVNESVNVIPDWKERNGIKSSPTFKKKFNYYDEWFKSHFLQYQDDKRALPLMYSFKGKFLEALKSVADNPKYSSSPLCFICNKELSNTVADYCLKNSFKFNGLLYCFEHQREI